MFEVIEDRAAVVEHAVGGGDDPITPPLKHFR
jgi:hypothetical protein